MYGCGGNLGGTLARAADDTISWSTEAKSVVMKRIAVLVGFLVVGLVSAFAPPGRETEAQANCFQETGFCITNPAFAEYFRVRGGTRILGYPVSRSFTSLTDWTAPCFSNRPRTSASVALKGRFPT